jgi:hypothetical protein
MEKLKPSTTKKKQKKGIRDHQTALQKTHKELLHIKEENRVRQEDSRKNKPI